MDAGNLTAISYQQILLFIKEESFMCPCPSSDEGRSVQNHIHCNLYECYTFLQELFQ